eukprot:jgi/Psemu1/9476/gm1.9476_g
MSSEAPVGAKGATARIEEEATNGAKEATRGDRGSLPEARRSREPNSFQAEVNRPKIKTVQGASLNHGVLAEKDLFPCSLTSFSPATKRPAMTYS